MKNGNPDWHEWFENAWTLRDKNIYRDLIGPVSGVIYPLHHEISSSRQPLMSKVHRKRTRRGHEEEKTLEEHNGQAAEDEPHAG